MKQPTSAPFVWPALAFLLLWPLLANAVQADVTDHLQQRWFVTEVVVFERLSINDQNTLEALASEEPGRQPRTLGAFEEGAAPPPQYTPDTQRMLRSRQIQAPAAEPLPLDFAIPAKSDFAMPSADASQSGALTAAQDAAWAQAVQDKMHNALAAFEADLQQRSFKFAAASHPRLANAVERIKRSRNYRVLWSGHWLQPVPTRDKPTPLLLQAGELGNGLFTLEGSLGLTVSRYLHLQAKLWYHDPAFSHETDALAALEQPNAVATPANPDQVGAGLIELNESGGVTPAAPKFMLLDAKRRMRSGMLHYLDHPKLGLLVRVDPVSVPAELTALVAAGERTQ